MISTKCRFCNFDVCLKETDIKIEDFDLSSLKGCEFKPASLVLEFKGVCDKCGKSYKALAKSKVELMITPDSKICLNKGVSTYG